MRQFKHVDILWYMYMVYSLYTFVSDQHRLRKSSCVLSLLLGSPWGKIGQTHINRIFDTLSRLPSQHTLYI